MSSTCPDSDIVFRFGHATSGCGAGNAAIGSSSAFSICGAGAAASTASFLYLTAGAAALQTTLQSARAQAYPTKPVRIIFGLASGSAGDILARLIGQWLSERLGQPFVIEDRVGAGGTLAAEAACVQHLMATRSSRAVRPTKSTRHSTTSSILFFSAISPQLLASPVARMSLGGVPFIFGGGSPNFDRSRERVGLR